MPVDNAGYMSWTRTIVVISLLVFGSHMSFGQAPASNSTGQRAGHAAAGAAATGSSRLSADVEQAIRWLPEDTESIIVARGPLKEISIKEILNPSGPFRSAGAPPPPQPDFHQLCLKRFTQQFSVAGGAFMRNIVRQKLRFVVAAARQFGVPVIGSGSTFEGCELIVFDNNVPDVGVQPANHEKIGVEEMENNRVVRVDTNWGGQDRKCSICYAKPKPNILIAATDANFVRTILQRMAKSSASSGTLLDFPEWKYVDTTAPVWGIRHRRTAAPFYYVFKGNADSASAMSKLVGLTFSYQSKPQTGVQLHFQCTDRPEKVLPRVFGKDYGITPITPLVASGWATICERSDSERWHPDTPNGMLFMISHFMGYVVCP